MDTKPSKLQTCDICTLVMPFASCDTCEFHTKTHATVLDVRTVEDCGKRFRVADVIEVGAILPHSVKLYDIKDLVIPEQEQQAAESEEIINAWGDCVCGHSAFDHAEGFMGKGTFCGKCDCRKFRLPSVTQPEPAQLVKSTTNCRTPYVIDDDTAERRDLWVMGRGG